MPIQTKVVRPEARNIIKTGLVSQSKTVRNYAIQLKSRVISDDHRKAVLKEMQREITAQSRFRPEKRSLQTAVYSRSSALPEEYSGSGGYAESAVNISRSKIQTAVNRGKKNKSDNAPSEKNFNNYCRSAGKNSDKNDYFSRCINRNDNPFPQTDNTVKIQTAVSKNVIQTQKNTELIQTEKDAFPEAAGSIKTEIKRLEEKECGERSKFYRKAIIRGMLLKQLRRKNIVFKVCRHNKARVYLRAVGMAERRLHNQKYTIANPDADNSFAIESAELVRSAVGAAVHAGGVVRTSVKNTAKGVVSGVSGIRSLVKREVKFGTKKDALKAVTAVGGGIMCGIKNAAADAGGTLLKTKIDKSKITDTGSETIKQGITEIRHIDNARKAVLNTARTSVKAGYAIKNMPKDTRAQVKRIKKNAEKVKKAAAVIKKIITSKAFWIVVGIAALILILVMLVSSFASIIVTAVSSLFSFLFSEDKDKDTEKILDDYSTVIVEYIEEKQSEIDEIVEGFVCDKREYPPYDEITELNQYGNKDISEIDENAVIAVLAALRYRDLREYGDEEKEIEFEFTDDEIKEVIEKFFDFEYRYEYGNCHYPYCKCKTETVIYNEGTPYEYVVETTEYYCDVQHEWLYGEVTNKSIDEVLSEYGFTDEEKALFEMYRAQIEAMNGGGENL